MKYPHSGSTAGHSVIFVELDGSAVGVVCHIAERKRIRGHGI